MKHTKNLFKIKQLQPLYNLLDNRIIKAYPVLKWAGGKQNYYHKFKSNIPQNYNKVV